MLSTMIKERKTNTEERNGMKERNNSITHKLSYCRSFLITCVPTIV